MTIAAPEKEKSVGKRFVPALALANFGTGMLDVIASLFLVDIALAFLGSSSKEAIGVASQIVAFSGIASVVFGVLAGFLSVRVKQKYLLLFGALCITIGAIGCYLAPTFIFLQIFYPFDGVGTIIVGSMAFSLIGQYLPLNRRANAISWVVAGAILATAIGFPVSAFIAGVGGWRSVLLWYVLPVSVLALVFAFFSIPSPKQTQETPVERKAYFNSFRQVLLNKSAVACLVGNMLVTAAGVWSFFAATFWRQRFLISVQSVSLITLGVVLIYALGSLIGGRFVDRVGRKRLVVSTWAFRGFLIALIVFMPDFWSALGMSFLATFVGGFAVTAGPTLSLEQAPKSRGMMMSLGAVFGSIGGTLGVSVGGLALSQFGFQILGVCFGVFGFASALVIFFLAKDPCKNS